MPAISETFVNKNNLVFGTDPEVFIVDDNNSAIPVPHLFDLGVQEIGFDKTRKHPRIWTNGKSSIIMDGVAAEFNPEPSVSVEEMFGKIQDILGELERIISPFGFKIAITPTVKYDFFRFYDAEDPVKAWCGIFGCDPDEDAIISDYNSPEIDVTTHPYRYGGGHLHISDNNQKIKEFPRPMIKLMAMTVGNYSIANSSLPEEEKLRMFKYGQPGRFRVQNYPNGVTGVEYRSPSNLWIAEKESINGMMFWAHYAHELLNNQEKAIKILNTFLGDTVDAIRNVDQEHANFILEQILRF